MIIKILELYPNLNLVYESLVENDKKRFESFMLDQFTIEKRPLDQILRKISAPENCRSKKSLYQQNLSK